MTEIRKPPYYTEAEVAVLGSVLLHNDVIDRVVDLLKPDDFYLQKHRIIFEAMLSMAEAGDPIDELSLHDWLKIHGKVDEVGGAAEIAFLSNRVPSAANVDYYARVVREKAVLRRLIATGTHIIQQCYDEVPDVEEFLDSVEQQVFALTEQRVRQSAFTMREVMQETVKILEKLFEEKKHVTGIPAGFIDLDTLTSGFQPGDLIIIAARPSMGKTSLVLNMLSYAALRQNIPVGFFSLEMPKEQLALRMICSEARVDAQRTRKGLVNDREWGRIIKAAGELSEAPIYIDDTPGLTGLELRARCRRMKAEKQVAIIGVDYLQLMSGRANIHSREQQISDISRHLKAIAKELNVPMLALSQLNRGPESRTDKRPMMSDLRESGAIEQDADLIGFIYRDEFYNKTTDDQGVAEIIVAKHRNGPTGTVKLRFFKEFTRFENMAREQENAQW